MRYTSLLVWVLILCLLTVGVGLGSTAADEANTGTLSGSEDDFVKVTVEAVRQSGARMVQGYNPQCNKTASGQRSMHRLPGGAGDLQIGDGADRAAHEELAAYFIRHGYRAVVKRPDAECPEPLTGYIVHVERRAPRPGDSGAAPTTVSGLLPSDTVGVNPPALHAPQGKAGRGWLQGAAGRLLWLGVLMAGVLAALGLARVTGRLGLLRPALPTWAGVAPRQRALTAGLLAMALVALFPPRLEGHLRWDELGARLLVVALFTAALWVVTGRKHA